MHELIGEDVNINFVAYGNADTEEVDGGYEFRCQVTCDVWRMRHSYWSSSGVSAWRGRVLR